MSWHAQLTALCGLALALKAVAEPYTDQVLEEGPQPALTLERDLGKAAGWPRGWRVEYNLASESGTQRSNTQGIGLSGYLDTPDYGALSLSAAINRARQGGGGGGLTEGRQSARLWRIDQTGLPLDGGWLANHSAGDLNTLQVPMARGFGRIGLPSSPLEGVTAQYNRGLETQLNASAGRPGVYSGLGVNGFDPGRGLLAFAGAQQGWANLPGVPGGSTAAFQFAGASGIADSANPAGEQDVRGLWGAWRWQGRAPWADTLDSGQLPISQRDGGLELQANAMTSRAERGLGLGAPARENGIGSWMDARWRSGRLEHGAGIFYLEPHLRWGTYNAISDLRGGYWRSDLATRQWQLSGSAEWSENVGGDTRPAFFTSATARYRIDTRHSVLGALAVRRQNAPGESAQLGWEQLSDWGQTQWRADILRTEGRKAQRFSVDNSFLLASDSTVAISLALDRSSEMGRNTRALSWGVVGTMRPWSAVSLNANLRGSQGGGARQLNGNVGVTWNVDSNWSMLAQYSSSRGQDPQTFAVVSGLTQAATAAATPAYSASRVQFTLRYEDRAGRAVSPIGGTPGSGAGSISGFVFFDGDNNGRREASEAGVPEVTVRLNGRFVTRTDGQGRYEFPAVAAGMHRLEIITDNVPLPWSPVASQSQPVEVMVRRTSAFDFALRRDP